MNSFAFLLIPFRALILPSFLPRRPPTFSCFPPPVPAPPLRCVAKAERARQALRHPRCGGAGRREAGALSGSGGRQAGRQADGVAGGWWRPCLLVRAGGSESLSVCEGGKERASGRASEQPAPSACSTSQAPPPPRRSAPRPGRAELGRARAMLLTVYCVRRDLSEVTFSLQVDADFELHNFRALCELESGIPAAESQVR